MRKMPEDLKYRKRILIVMTAVLLILHAMYVPFMILYEYINGDIVFGNIASVLAVALVAVALLLKYFLYGVLLTVYDNYTPRQCLPFTVTAIISLLISRIGEIIIFAFTSVALADGEAQSFIYTAFAGFAIDIAVIIILGILTKSFSPKKISRFTVLALVVCIAPFATDIFNEILTFRIITKEFSSAGMIMTSEEICSAVWGFAQHFIKAMCGFAVLFFVNRALTVPSKKK